MNTSDDSRFFQTVRAALGHPVQRRRMPPPDLYASEPSPESRRLLEQIRSRRRADRRALLEDLNAAAGPINLKVVAADSVAAAQRIIVETVTATPTEWGGAKQVCAWRHPLIDRLTLATALDGHGIPLIVAEADDDPRARGALARAVRDSYIGVTAADYCLADTATLVLRTRPGQPRSTSLVPSVHLAVITAEQVLANLKELYAVLRWRDHSGEPDLSNCLTFVSGPSKTADIEATLVHGAHGPREVVVIVLENEPADR
jgi:L-lactate dehydrogenase complex protein LldG